MDVGMLHTHRTMVFLYLAILAIRVVLLAMGNKQALDKVSGRTRIASIVISVLMLGTGIFLMVRSPEGTQPYTLLKLAFMVASIPIGIIGFKKSNTAMAAISLILLLGSLTLALVKPPFLRSGASKEVGADAGADKAVLEAGKIVYGTACNLCHGPEGTAGFQGAKNLQESQLSDDAIRDLIRKGKGMMPANTDLSDQQVSDVIAYVKYLRK